MNEQQTHKAQTLEYHPNTTTLHKEETGSIAVETKHKRYTALPNK
jgi:hypothetical protein